MNRFLAHVEERPRVGVQFGPFRAPLNDGQHRLIATALTRAIDQRWDHSVLIVKGRHGETQLVGVTIYVPPSGARQGVSR